MLYQPLIEAKYHETRLPAGEPDVPVRVVEAEQGVSTSRTPFVLALSVAGNVVAGAAWLGALLMAPMWMERLLSVL
ncbi:hypothetical protein F3N42_01795 [Marinihelvus fidelis]|uniref:Uncharacterized protein n=1 Tax=Marinihelvus fidelis TaxID=2613842 RepID=A0A5N0TEW4_9GAMM|nr:hypothetical protein [Marinihelvus fidelis]KAA9133118.1 hypothetical protein F3N42_01795 [Marinihelvus fidelis]